MRTLVLQPARRPVLAIGVPLVPAQARSHPSPDLTLTRTLTVTLTLTLTLTITLNSTILTLYLP